MVFELIGGRVSSQIHKDEDFQRKLFAAQNACARLESQGCLWLMYEQWSSKCNKLPQMQVAEWTVASKGWALKLESAAEQVLRLDWWMLQCLLKCAVLRLRAQLPQAWRDHLLISTESLSACAWMTSSE
jgi:hypothetical protein